MLPVGLGPWLFTSLETTLPVVPAGNSLNSVRSPAINDGHRLNMYQIMFVYSPDTGSPPSVL